MNCLCCGKPLRTPDETGWHKACLYLQLLAVNIHIPNILLKSAFS
ncbi:hypothetical protein [Eubacterium coprostanoligenes]|nr:hypothetical protein [Eubacterium coprostanoligenes]